MSNESPPAHFKFCPKCGAEKIRRFQVNAIDCECCGFTLYFNPYSAAAAIIEDDTGKILAIERARDPAKGKFGLPGGFVDYGERAEEALLREVKEEVNLDLNRIEALGSFANIYSYKQIDYPTLDWYFIGHINSFAGIQAEKSEVNSIHFVDPQKVPESQWAFPSLRSAIKAYLKR